MIRLTTSTMRMTARPRRLATADRSASATRSGGATTDHGPRTTDHGPKGFTLIELMVVVIVLALLVALLLPAIGAAMRTARYAAVSSEINLLSTALESFKAKYGDYPPSRFLAVENGNYSQFFGSTGSVPLTANNLDPTSPGSGDITLGQLAQRSAAALRKFFPKISTSGPLPAGVWYDFNGNGGKGPDAPYILHGHECLVFFLGGVPLFEASSQSYGLTGFGKDPTNPFSNNRNDGNLMYNANRQQPFFEFNAGRLFLDPNGTSGIPGYYDSLGNAQPPLAGGAPTALNFYVYFSAYGGGNYDPNDVNFVYPLSGTPAYEVDGNLSGPIGLKYLAGFPVYYPNPPGGNSPVVSPSPNPYTVGTTTPTGSGTITYQKPQTYQIISAGLDGLYGVGGQYVSSTSTSATTPLPVDQTNPSPYVNTMDAAVRQREQDNLTNFTAGKLQ